MPGKSAAAGAKGGGKAGSKSGGMSALWKKAPPAKGKGKGAAAKKAAPEPELEPAAVDEVRCCTKLTIGSYYDLTPVGYDCPWGTQTERFR